jgi:hypothetical protein
MHLIECDGCKRQEVFYRGLQNNELETRSPEGWGARPAFFKGGNAHWEKQRELLIHACRIECAHSAALRIKMALPGVVFQGERYRYNPINGRDILEKSWTRWEGFPHATPDQWAELAAVPLDEGGQPPLPEVKAPKKGKKSPFGINIHAGLQDPPVFHWQAHDPAMVAQAVNQVQAQMMGVAVPAGNFPVPPVAHPAPNPEADPFLDDLDGE